MKIEIILNGKGGELDRQTITVNDDDSAEVSHAIYDAIEAWTLSPGDTIVINELE